MKQSLLSAVIVTYNCDKFIATALDCVLAQDLDDYEVIVINNASTDNTAEILEKYRNPRVVVVENDVNGGPSAANLALPLARGKYVARLDADDLALPGRLRTQCEYMESHPEVALCGTDYEIIREDGSVFDQSRCVYDPFEIRWKLGWGNFVGHSTVIMRKDIAANVGGYDQSLWCAGDYDLISRMASAHQVAVIPLILGQYRVYAGNISHLRKHEMTRCSKMLSTRHLQRILQRRLAEAVAK